MYIRATRTLQRAQISMLVYRVRKIAIGMFERTNQPRRTKQYILGNRKCSHEFNSSLKIRLVAVSVF